MSLTEMWFGNRWFGHLLLIHVDHEVLLRFELPRELVRRNHVERSLLVFNNLVSFHLRYLRFICKHAVYFYSINQILSKQANPYGISFRESSISNRKVSTDYPADNPSSKWLFNMSSNIAGKRRLR